MSKNIYKVLTLSIVLLLILVSGCSTQSSIVSTTRGFIRAMLSGNSDMAANYVCQEGGITVLFGIKTNWSRDSYEILEDNGLNARVNVRGRIQIRDRDIKDFLQKLQAGINLIGADWPAGIADPANIPMAMTIIVDFNFYNLQLQNNGDNWCVKREGVVDFYEYLAQLIVGQISP